MWYSRIVLVAVPLLLLPILSVGLAAASEEDKPLSEEIIIARGLFNDGLFELAVRELESYAAKGVRKGEECTVILMLGKSYYLSGRYDDAAGSLAEVLKKRCSFAQQEEAYFYQGDSFLKLGKGAEAKKSFERLQYLYPESSFIPATKEKLGEIFYREALDDFNSQKYSSALSGFEKVLKLRPHSIPKEELLVRIGDAYFYLGKYGKAEDAYVRAAEFYSDSDEGGRIRFQIAAVKYNLGKYDEAMEGMKEFLENYPDHPLSSRGRSTILWSLYKSGRYEEALEYLEELEESEKDLTGREVGELILSASRLLASGDYPEAVKLLEKRLARFGRDPLDGEVMLLLAEAYRGAGREAMEKAAYLEIIKRYPSSPSAQKSRYILGQIGFERGALAESARYFGAFLEGGALGDLADDARYYLAESLYLMGEYEEAKRHFSILLDGFKGSEYRQRSDLRIADIDMSAGRYRDAALRYISVIKKHPGKEREEELLWKTAEAFRLGGDFKAAEKVYRRYLKKYPEGKKVSDAYVALGDISYLLEDYRGGIEIFRKLADKTADDPSWPGYALKLARGYLKLQDTQNALRTLDAIVKRYPDSGEAAKAYYLKGLVAQDGKDYGSANKQFLLLLKRFPRTPVREEVTWHIGNNYFKLGKYRKALKVFKDFAGRFPESHRNSEEMIRKCYAAMGDFKSALEVSKTFFEMSPDRVVDLKKRSEEALALFQVGSYGDVIKVAEEVMRKFPSHRLSAEIMIIAGESALRDGLNDRAREFFVAGRNALQGGALKDFAHFRLGEMAYREKEYRECIMELDRMALSPADDGEAEDLVPFIDPRYMAARSRYLRGEAYLALNLDDKALENFRSLVDEYPDLRGMEKEKLKAGLVLQQHREYDKAIGALRQLIAVTDDVETKAEAQYWIGECYQYKGDTDRAIVEYLKVTYLYPSANMWAITARYMAAQVYQEAGRYEEAVNLYKKVAEESEDKRKSEYARKRIEELLKRMGTGGGVHGDQPGM